MEGTGANLRLPLNPPFFIETDLTYDVRTPSSITRGFSDVVASGVTLDMARPAAAGVTPQLQGRAWDLNLRPQTTSQLSHGMLTTSAITRAVSNVEYVPRLPTPW